MAKYSEAKDKKIDAQRMKGMTPKQKAAFKKADKAHKKPKTMEEDARLDKTIINKIKAKNGKGKSKK